SLGGRTLDSPFQLTNGAAAKSLTDPQSALLTAGNGTCSGKHESGTLFWRYVRPVLGMSQRRVVRCATHLLSVRADFRNRPCSIVLVGAHERTTWLSLWCLVLMASHTPTSRRKHAEIVQNRGGCSSNIFTTM
ncbi:Protein of unknown function, partial [Gryllus bimaculatus]